MKVSLLTENINKTLPFINRAISSRSQLPVLLNFLLKAENGELYISATDLEIGIRGKIPASIEEDGETTVPAKPLLELLANMDNGKVSIYTKNSSLFLQAQKARSQLQTQQAADFPRLFEEKGQKEMVIKKEAVEKEFKKVVFAASQDSGRPALSGLLIKKNFGVQIY